jgi:cell division protein FtsZ
MNLTKGLGAGAKHDIGQAAADESLNEIVSYLQGSNMVFITAGMGGGTGTGASHVIARAARELNILTVGVTTLPFSYEGPKRMRRALEGLEELKKHLDTVIVVPNQNLFKVASETTTFEESFSLSNDVLKHGVQSVTDLMVRPGMINLDFADVETVMSSMGKAMMGTGEADGENRAMVATEMALNNPLIDEYSLQGAKGLLVNITGGSDIKLFEVDQAVNKIRAEVDPEAELIFGAIKDEAMNGKMRVSIVATSLDGHKPESKTVLNMVNRIQNRNNGYSDSLFPKNTHIENNTFNSIDGATALKLDEQLEVNENTQSAIVSEPNPVVNDDIAAGISIESASYIENSHQQEQDLDITNYASDETNTEEYTPKLFVDSEEMDRTIEDNSENLESEKLFEQDNNAEEDFEIPAFLRRQKF